MLPQSATCRVLRRRLPVKPCGWYDPGSYRRSGAACGLIQHHSYAIAFGGKDRPGVWARRRSAVLHVGRAPVAAWTGYAGALRAANWAGLPALFQGTRPGPRFGDHRTPDVIRGRSGHLCQATVRRLAWRSPLAHPPGHSGRRGRGQSGTPGLPPFR